MIDNSLKEYKQWEKRVKIEGRQMQAGTSTRQSDPKIVVAVGRDFPRTHYYSLDICTDAQ